MSLVVTKDQEILAGTVAGGARAEACGPRHAPRWTSRPVSVRAGCPATEPLASGRAGRPQESP